MKFSVWYKENKGESLEEREKRCHNAVAFANEITSSQISFVEFCKENNELVEMDY